MSPIAAINDLVLFLRPGGHLRDVICDTGSATVFSPVHEYGLVGGFTNARKQTSHIVSFLDPLLYADLVLAFGVATDHTSGAASSGWLRILVTIILC